MSLNEVEIQVGKLRPLEIVLKDSLRDVIDDVAGGKMTSAEVYGILGELQLIVMGVFDE